MRKRLSRFLGSFADKKARPDPQILLQIERMPIAHIMWDEKFRVASWNPAAENIFGYTSQEALGKHPHDLIVPQEGRADMDGLCRRLLAGDDSAPSVNENITKSGRRITCRWSNTPLKNEDGSVVGVLSMAEDITAIAEAEEALRKSEEFNNSLLINAPNPVFVSNLDTSIRYVNPAFEKLTGFSGDELIGRKSPYPWWPPDKVEEYEQANIAGRKTEDVRLEREYRKKNGETIWASIHITHVRYKGVTRYYISNWVDFTQRKKMESALKASENRFRTIVENARDMVYRLRFSPGPGFDYVSPSSMQLLGYAPEEFYAEPVIFPRCVHPDDREFFRTQVQTFLVDGPIVLRMVRKDGTTIWVDLHETRIYDNGKLVAVEGAARDVTQSMLAEQDLRASQQFSSSLTENAPYPMMVINSDYSIRYVNPALEKITGYSKAELIGKNMPYPYWAENDFVPVPGVTDALTQNRPEAEIRVKKKSGEYLWVIMRRSIIKEGLDIKYFLSIWVDVSAQKLAIEEKERLYQLEKNIRQELQTEIKSRAEFMRALVHELKTPLTPILISAETLEMELKDPLMLSLAKNIHRGAESLNKRVDELLDLARGEVGKLEVTMEPVNPGQLVREVFEYMQPAVRSADQTLEMRLEDNLPDIMGDEDRLKQVLFNLINNAVKYSAAGARTEIHARIDNGNLVIDISDTGRGMSEEEQSNLFKPYYRIQEGKQVRGLGLGLALSRKLIELQGGRIWVQSRKGAGSTFSFSLPCNSTPPSEEGLPSPQTLHTR